jgi:S-DNA-T family DNA segregation ATPase FtsK/SpoIIIE
LGLLIAALIVAAGLWWSLPGPVGAGVRALGAGALGTVSMLLPLLVGALGVRLLRHPDQPAATRRVVVGTTIVLVAASGLVHLANGTPIPADGATAMRSADGPSTELRC